MRNFSNCVSSFFCSLVADLFDGLFIIYWLCWFFIRFSRLTGNQISFLNGWLTDFVFVPIVVHFSLVLGNHMSGKNSIHKYSLLQILTFSLYTSLVFELLLPRITTYNTGDWLDVVTYFSGGIFYFYIHQNIYIKKLRTRSIKHNN